MKWILLHGFSGSPASWQSVVPHLPLGNEYVALDLPTHTTSFRATVDALAEALGPGPVGVAGYSLGARLTLGLLAHYPERIVRAVLIGAHCGLSSAEQRQERATADARWATLLRAQGIAAFVSEWEKLPLWETQKKVAVHALKAQREQRLQHDPHALAQLLDATSLATMPDYRAMLASCSQPLVLMAGSEDLKFVALAHEMSQVAPYTRTVIVPNAGHNLLLEAPAYVAAAF